jgi:hypothetical protein
MSPLFGQTECPDTTDDIPNLTVGTLSLADITDASSSTGPALPSPGGGSYSVGGSDPLTLDSGIDVPTTALGSGDGEMSVGLTGIGLPIVLGGDNSWSLGPDVTLELSGGVTGDYPLAIIGGNDSTIVLNSPVEVGPVTISDTVVVVGFPSEAPVDLNGVDGQPITLDGGILDANATLGPLTMNGGELPLGGFGLPVSADSVNLSPSTEVSTELQPDGAAPELESGGVVNLASAELTVNDDGCEAPGTVTTLVQAQGGLVGTFTDADGNPITNGEIVQPPYGCSTDVSDPIEINYTANSVTATLETPTVVSPLPLLPAPSPASSAPSPSAVSAPVAPAILLLGALRPESQGIAATLECTASAGSVCDVTGKLTSVELRTNARVLSATAARASEKRRAIIDGSATTTIPAGATATITVALDSAARQLLAALHKLPATLTVTLSSGGTSRTAFTSAVTLASHRKSRTR